MGAYTTEPAPLLRWIFNGLSPLSQRCFDVMPKGVHVLLVDDESAPPGLRNIFYVLIL